MYGNGWKDNGNGTFTSTAKQSGYSPLDLYLMGMIPKEQVPPMLLIDNPAIDKTQLPHLGDTISGTAKTVTIDDIIADEGACVPDAASSQKKFNFEPRTYFCHPFARSRARCHCLRKPAASAPGIAGIKTRSGSQWLEISSRSRQ
jgi:hypothetical protein